MLCPRRKGRRLDGEGQQRAIPSETTTPEKTMPHVIVKLWPGKSEQEKTRLAEEITKDVMDVLHTAKRQCRSPSKKSNHRIGPRRSIHRKSLTVRRSSTRNRDTQRVTPPSTGCLGLRRALLSNMPPGASAST